jgi:uronate dehydrogenase
MTTWLSLDDLMRLLHRALVTPRVGHTIAFGISDNDGRWWDDRHAAFLGYKPQDSSRQFADKLPKEVAYPPTDDITTFYQGGVFLHNGPKYKP